MLLRLQKPIIVALQFQHNSLQAGYCLIFILSLPCRFVNDLEGQGHNQLTALSKEVDSILFSLVIVVLTGCCLSGESGFDQGRSLQRVLCYSRVGKTLFAGTCTVCRCEPESTE